MNIENWGCIAYQQAMEKQLALVEAVANQEIPERVILCSHPPVVTLGRSSSDADLSGWQGETVKVSRGGRATYHGPSQIVVYPILDLTNENRSSYKSKDIHAYLRQLEKVIILTLEHFNMPAQAIVKQSIDKAGKKISFTGVWVGEYKVASIGIAVKRWVTYHGAAINFSADPQAFSGINPCGFNPQLMKSVEELADQPVTRDDFERKLKENLTSFLV